MQIGYNYYAPRIIKEMEAGELDNPLTTKWWKKWQSFLKVYSDQSIKNTMDRTLEMPEQAIKAIWDKIFNLAPSGGTTDTGFSNVLYEGDSDQFGVRLDRGGTAERHAGQRDAPNNVPYTSGTYRGYSENQLNKKDSSGQTLRDFLDIKEAKRKAEQKARDRTASEAVTKKAQKELEAVVARTGVVTSRRKAGQSQIRERNNLIQAIAVNTHNIKVAQGRGLSTAQSETNLRNNQAKLTILLQRYSF